MPVYKTPKGWKIENVPGYSPTKKEADERLKAIKTRQGKIYGSKTERKNVKN